MFKTLLNFIKTLLIIFKGLGFHDNKYKLVSTVTIQAKLELSSYTNLRRSYIFSKIVILPYFERLLSTIAFGAFSKPL